MTLRLGFNARVLSEPGTRGLSRYTTNLLRTLSSRGDLRLFLFLSEAPVAEHVSGIDAEIVVVPAKRETTWEAWTLPAALRAAQIDVFHAPADRGLPLIKSCACVVTVHDSYEHTYWRRLFPSWRRRYWYWKNELANRLIADAVITVSATTKRDLSDLGVAHESTIRVTHLASAPEFSPLSSDQDDEVIRTYGLTAPYFLYVGGYDERKNVDALVRAFDSLGTSAHRLVIAARKHGNFTGLESQWRNFSSFHALQLIEPCDQHLPALYRRAHAFVNPSVWESFSFQTVEAMACGTPLLSSNRKAIPEIAGDAALYFDPGDVSQIANAMSKLLVAPGLRDELSARGLRRIGNFSWSKTADETVQVYEAVYKARR
jgi:glycosyltransferase involved in cell wall biosynthesis